MSKKKLQTVKLADIETNLFVRRMLNDDRVLFFADLIENKVELPPMQVASCVDGKWPLVDGRHRKAAYDFHDIEEVVVEIIEVTDDIDLLTKAFAANIGGAQPPTREDIEHVISECFKRGVGEKRLPVILGMPAGMIRDSISRVKARAKRQKLNQAISLVAEDNLRVAEAAQKIGIDEEELRMSLTSRRKRDRKQNREVKRSLTQRYRNLGRTNTAMIEKMLNKFDDGDIIAKDVVDILDHVSHLQDRHSKNLADNKARFLAKVNGVLSKGKE